MHRAGEDLVVLVAVQAVDQQPAETAEADVRRDRGRRAHLQQRAAQAADDQRQRHRHLGLEQHLQSVACPCRRRRRRRPRSTERIPAYVWARIGGPPAPPGRPAPASVDAEEVTSRGAGRRWAASGPALPMSIAMNAPRLVCPMSRPTGSAMSGADQQRGQRVADVLGEALGIEESRSPRCQLAPSKR